jgi:hypothetical protein
VMRNGLSGDRAKYPFYKTTTIPLNWKAGTSKTFIPNISYVPFDEMRMYIHEDFELGNSFSPIGTDTSLQKSNNAKYGLKCGAIYLDANHTKSENIIVSKVPMIANKNYFVEIDYQCDVQINVDVLCTTASGSTTIVALGGMNPKATWNKIYFDIGALATAVRAKDYNLIISTYKPSSQATGYALIDNVKLIGPR